MEILKSIFKKVGKHALLLAFALIIMLTLCTLSVAFSLKGSGVAYADNGNIGASGGAIEIADVTADKVSATFSNRDTGVKLKITLPLASTNIYFAYEVDSSEQVWAISGDAGIDKDIPYIKHQGGVESFVVPSATIAEQVESSWTDVSVIYDKRVFYIDVHYNGTLYVACDMDGETAKLTASSIIKDIDNLAPKMQTDRVVHGAVNAEGQYVFGLRLTFIDTMSTSVLSSARSGLKEILILRTDAELNDLTPEQIEGNGVETMLSWELLSPLQATLEHTISFDVDKDGYYYYFVIDRVGNLAIGTLFDGKFERENYADTDDRFMMANDITRYPDGGTFSIKNYMITIGQELSDYKEQTNSKVYSTAWEAYSALLLRCYTGDAVSDKVSVTKDWFSFFNGPYTAFKNAYSVGATYEVSLINGDLLSGKLSAINLNKNTLPSLGGDQVVASFIVAKYDLSALPSEALSVSGLSGKGYAYKLNYTLTVSGVQSAVANVPLQYEVVGLPSELQDFVVVMKTDSGYTAPTQTKGENWIRFELQQNSAELYLICTDSQEKPNLTWLWITLGVVGGVMVVAGVVVIVLWKTGKLKK